MKNMFLYLLFVGQVKLIFYFYQNDKNLMINLYWNPVGFQLSQIRFLGGGQTLAVDHYFLGPFLKKKIKWKLISQK